MGPDPVGRKRHQDRPQDLQRPRGRHRGQLAFRGAWKAGRRCLVLADGYYEWRKSDKQPFAIALATAGR